MNKSYRSIWNPSLGCYVAAPESAMAHPAGTSSSRAVRSGCPMRSRSALVLEPRILFDGAMLVTAIETDSAEAPAAESADEGDAAGPTVSEPPVAATGDTPDANVTEEATEEATEESTGDTAEDTAQEAAAEPATTDATDDGTDVATEPEEATRTEVVFVDGRVSDPGAFASDGREVIVLSTEQDGMTQIASALAGRTGIDAIHIVSHGGDGYLSLGSGSITAETIQSTQLASLQLIGQALSAEGDLLIYACDYAAGSDGLEAMGLIAEITGADVAASTDATGHESLGGDWALEQSTGEIETTALAPLAWMNALDFTFTGAGSVGAVGMANNIMGAGVTVVSATYQGGATQSGTFTAGSGVSFGANVLGFTSGTILSTSTSATGVAGPNNNGGYGTDAPGVDGDAALNAMAGNPTFDAAILNISFVPDVPPGGNVGDVGRMTLEIVFGSEEYLEYVGQINDVMEVTINGQVVSLVPNASGGESTIGIDSVNTTQNQSLYVNNTTGTYNTQMDGFTITIPMVFDVIVGQTNTLRLAVADAVDTAYDSWLFVRADSGQTVVVAEDDQVTTATNLPITVDLTANDYSLAGGNMTLTHIQGQAVTQGQVITLGSGIELTVGSGGQVAVTGNGSSAANDTFTYQVSNGMGGVASATVNVAVTAPNLNPPAAQDDIEAVLADATLSDSVLTNNGIGADTDPNGNPLSVVQVNLTSFTPGQPISLSSGALLTMNANGSYVYDPNGAFDGLAGGATTTDSFSYTITDGEGGNDTATVTITVTGVNDAPVALNDSYTASEEGAVLLGNPGSNDSDADGDQLELVYASTTGSNGGSIGTDDSGNLVFVAGSSFDDLAVGQTRDTTFTYTLSDGLGGSDTATITVTVQGANDAPDAQNDHYDVSEDGGHTLGSVRANDSDIDSSEIWAEINTTEGSNGGTFSQDDSGNLIFVPGSSFDDLAAGQTRDTSFSYVLHDSDGGQSAATVTVTVHGVNDAPVAEADPFVATEDAASAFGRVSVNDWDVDGTELWVDTSVSGAGDQGGFFSFDDSGSLIFNPGTDFDDLAVGESRDTQFVYTLYDDQGASSTGTVTVTVLGANDNPVAQNDSFVAYEDSALSLGSLAGNDSDVDGDGLQVVLPGTVEGSTGGRFWLDDSGSLIFDPEGDFDDLSAGDTRETSFTYTVADGLGGSSEATVTVAVHGVVSGDGDPVVTPPGGGETGGGDGSPPPSYPNQIVFVDARVPDPQAFSLDGRELVILSTESDGLVQVASALAGRTGIEAIHIVSHGSEGTVTLGLGNIDAGNVQAEQIAALQTIAQSLTVEADILVYACEFAGGEAGLNAMLLLSQYTQADVAASLFVTGSPSLGGNWSLEATVGSVESAALAPQNWNHLLDVPQAPQRAEATQVAKRFFLTPTDCTPQEHSADGLRHMHATTTGPRSLSLDSSGPVRVQGLETVLRERVAAAQPQPSTEVAEAAPQADVQAPATDLGHTPVWPVERPQIWSASQPWLEELAAEAEAEADGTAHAAPGFRAQLGQLAQWGLGRPLTRAAAHA